MLDGSLMPYTNAIFAVGVNPCDYDYIVKSCNDVWLVCNVGYCLHFSYNLIPIICTALVLKTKLIVTCLQRI